MLLLFIAVSAATGISASAHCGGSDEWKVVSKKGLVRRQSGTLARPEAKGCNRLACKKLEKLSIDIPIANVQ